MTGYLLIAAALVVLWHSAALIGCLFLSKLLFFSRFGLLRAVTDPGRTFKAAGSGLRKITHHLIWAAGGIFVITVLI